MVSLCPLVPVWETIIGNYCITAPGRYDAILTDKLGQWAARFSTVLLSIIHLILGIADSRS